MREEFSRRTKLDAWTRAKGHCETCGCKILAGAEYDHETPCELGGDNSLGNCRCLCPKCHRLKTSTADVPRIAKAKRQEAKHKNAETKSSNPIPGSRRSPFKRLMSGKTVMRSVPVVGRVSD
mgnify:CR=1 FL=1